LVSRPAPSGVLDIPLPHGDTLRLGERPLVMAILNVTPDSFSDGGRHADTGSALRHAERLVAEGADLLDVGGESTRPGADEIPDEEQLRRLLPVVRELRVRHPGIPISIDTRSAVVARTTVAAGAHIVNDVSGLGHDPGMAAAVAECGAPAVVMHMRGSPADMRERTGYTDLVDDVLAELGRRLDTARAAGIRSVIADPGIGFAKTAEQSAALLAATPRFLDLGVPLLVGPSRKSFLALATGDRAGPPDTTRLHASVAAATVAALLGAHIVRVHDVTACADGMRLAHALRTSEGWTSPADIARMAASTSPDHGPDRD
jgi:dihydropteroate synthase